MQFNVSSNSSCGSGSSGSSGSSSGNGRNGGVGGGGGVEFYQISAPFSAVVTLYSDFLCVMLI